MRQVYLTGALALVTATAAVPLAAQTNTFSAGTSFNAPSLTGFQTTGSLMGGMVVTWSFNGGATGSDTWRDLGGGLWGVSMGGFQVIHGAGDDTFTSSWSVTNGSNSVVSAVQFNGALGRTLFDCGYNGSGCDNTGTGGAFGTEGSFLGRSMTTAGGNYGGGILGFYSNRVGINGGAPVGDLFEQLRIEFASGLNAGETYFFSADTDNSLFDAPPPTSEVVPEPATMTLLATGLAGMAATRRRKKQN